jgi:hypothetical protein
MYCRLYAKNLATDTHEALLTTLAQLYTSERNYQRALSIYLNLHHRAVFALIDRYQLFPQVTRTWNEINVFYNYFI